MKMTTEEAFVKVLQRHGIQHAFGIIGSATLYSQRHSHCKHRIFWFLLLPLEESVICIDMQRVFMLRLLIVG